MHTLYNVSTVIEHFTYVVRVNSTREMWVAVVSAITTGCANPLQYQQHWFMFIHVEKAAPRIL